MSLNRAGSRLGISSLGWGIFRGWPRAVTRDGCPECRRQRILLLRLLARPLPLRGLSKAIVMIILRQILPPPTSVKPRVRPLIELMYWRPHSTRSYLCSISLTSPFTSREMGYAPAGELVDLIERLQRRARVRLAGEMSGKGHSGRTNRSGLHVGRSWR